MTKPTTRTITILAYIAIVCLMIPAYWYGREVMTWFAPYIMVYESYTTLNFFLLFFLYGVACDRYTKGMSKRKGWTIWIVGLVLLMALFKFVGGYETII